MATNRMPCQLRALPMVAPRPSARHAAVVCCLHKPASAAAAGTAAGAAAAAAAAAHSDAPVGAGASGTDDDDVPLGTADLRRFMEQRGIAAQVVPPLDGAAPPAGSIEVKSLVFLVDLQPLVLVLPLAARVDERRLAQMLHTARNRVRLAPPASLVQLCGYTIGNVPPFGHRQQLPVIVDSSVADHTTCYAGGGSEDFEILISVPELLRAAAATVADIARPQGSPQGDAARAEQRAAVATAAAAALPVPWPAGQEDVVVEGVVAHRRKIARLLLFANLVPMEAAAAAAQPPGEQAMAAPAAYLRRAWRHPETGQPCEVQLIMGKTLEWRLGSEATAELLRSIRTGQCVRVSGRVQTHLARLDSAVRDRPDACLDVVVSDIQTIARPSAGLAAADASTTSSSLAAGTSSSAGASSSSPAAPSLAPTPGCYELPPGTRIVLVDGEEGLAQLEDALFGGSFSVDSAGAGSPGAGLASSSIEADRGPGSSSLSSGSYDGGEVRRSPRGFGADSSGSSFASTYASLASLDVRGTVGTAFQYRLVVGIDCEWQPYERGQPKSRVSLLQLATPGAVFLLDMLALCGADGGAMGDASSSSSSSSAGRGCDGDDGSSGGSSAGAGAGSSASAAEGGGAPLQRRLSVLLDSLWGDPSIIKAGFGLGTDLQRLCESYPWLPCFGSQGAVPLRSHVDVQLLARTALGGHWPNTRRRMSLSALAELVLRKPIDKSQQCSDWGQRPLSQPQLAYAAADAHALVAMCQVLQQRRPGLDTPFWVSTFSARLTDVAAFHPSKRGGRAVGPPGDTSSSSAGSSGSSRRSSAPRRRPAAGGTDSAEGGKRQGQTRALDCNVEYLLQTYLGRQLPQGGKAAAVRAAAAFSGRPESGRTPSFPRGCGGALEWRNAHMLFVNLPEPGEPAAAGRRYHNEFLWLDAPGSSASDGGSGGSSAGMEGSPAGPAAAGAGAALPAERRMLCMTWWPGRGQTLAHPAIRRLLAAGARGAMALGLPAAVEAVRSSLAASGGGALAAGQQAVQEQQRGEEEHEREGGEQQRQGEEQQQRQQVVLLFVRAGGSPYIFAGRLVPAAVGSPPAGSAGSESRDGEAGEAAGGCCVTWQLVDAGELLAQGGAFRELLRLDGS